MKSRNRIVLLLVIIFLIGGVVLWLAKQPSAPIPLAATRPQGIASVTPAKPLEPTSDSIQSLPLPTDQSNPKTGFGTLNILERNTLLTEIRKKDFVAIFQIWLDAGRIEQDLMKQGAVSSTLANAMRERIPPTEFYDQLKAFIADGSNSDRERGQLIAVLSDVASNESINLLIYEAMTLSDKNLKNIALSGVGRLGSGGAQEHIASAVDQVWRDSNDRYLLGAASTTMAQNGSPSSIELLLAAALTGDGRQPPLPQGDSHTVFPSELAPAEREYFRKLLAWNALPKVYTHNALPPLAALLKTNPPDSPANTLAFNTLRHMSGTDTAQTMMEWLQTTDERAGPMAYLWIAEAQYVDQLRAAEAALDPKVTFRTEANRDAIRRGLAEYNRTHRTIPVRGGQ